jgi:hypothetical protein
VRTTKSTVTFEAPFTLNEYAGELPAGTYDIEVDEEEIIGVETSAYRRVGTLLFVHQRGSTTSIAVDGQALEAALQADANKR